jgi:hypothetical protein
MAYQAHMVSLYTQTSRDEERAEALHCYIENLEETYQDKIEEDKYSKQDFKRGILA